MNKYAPDTRSKGIAKEKPWDTDENDMIPKSLDPPLSSQAGRKKTRRKGCRGN